MQQNLINTLKTLEPLNVNVKVGGGIQYHYCGKVNDNAYAMLKDYLNREIVDTYNSFYEDNTIVIIFKGEEGDKRGKYWTIDECLGLVKAK